MQAHDNMRMLPGGMVMNENHDRLPRDCPAIAGELEIVVRAGVEFARDFPGTMFAYDRREWDVAPCTRVSVTLVNQDSVRHQWMIHGLPRYLYPGGMFSLEVTGPAEGTGVFIVPSGKKTYLVHCDVPHHMEKGMKAQLKVRGGDGNLPSIPGVSARRRAEPYERRWETSAVLLALGSCLIGVALAVGAIRAVR